MKQLLSFLAAIALLGLSLAACTKPPSPPVPPVPQSEAPEVKIVTSVGNIVVQLDPKQAPITVKNFLAYVNDGFYAGTIFHRVMPGFVIQGGGYTADLKVKKTRPPIPIESRNGLHNTRGTIAMARTRDPNSATSQFYINLVNNKRLDASPTSPGYTVFGHVVAGMAVVDKIAAVKTAPMGPFRNAPVVPIVIEKVVLVKPKMEP